MTALLLPAAAVPCWILATRSLAAHPVIESGTGALLFLLLATCVVTDVARRRIPNWATYSAVVWGLLLSGSRDLWPGAERLAAISFSQSALGTLACFGVMLLAYSAAGGGAGDVKLMAAIGALLGTQLGLQVLAWSYLLAATGIVAWSVWTEGPWKLGRAMFHKLGAIVLPLWISPPGEEDQRFLRRPMPLAPAFAAGVVVVLVVGDLM